MCRFVCLALVYLAWTICQAADTTTKSTTNEPHETISITFKYDRNTHHLIMRKTEHHNIECYIAQLSDDERVQVHTSDGMRAIELRLIASHTFARPVTLDMVSAGDIKTCDSAYQHGRNATYTYFAM